MEVSIVLLIATIFLIKAKHRELTHPLPTLFIDNRHRYLSNTVISSIVVGKVGVFHNLHSIFRLGSC